MGIVHRIEHRIEEILFIFIIISSVLEIINFLPGDFNFIKKLISWLAMAYLVYKISPTKLLFNNKHHYGDIFIILAFFLFIAKNIIQLAFTIEGKIFHSLFEFLKLHSQEIDLIGLWIGSIIILLVSLFLAKSMKIYKPSLIEFLKIKRNIKIVDFVEKFVIIVLFIFAFFLLVFNLLMEWLTWVIDSTLIVVFILTYLFFIIRYHKKYHADTLIFRIGNAGENFYKKVLLLFHTKKTILLALLGLLVLHTATDVSSFMVPYVFGSESLYFYGFDETHQPIIASISSQLQDSGVFNVQLIIIHIFNYLALLFLLLFPAYFWNILFQKKKIVFSPYIRTIVIMSLLVIMILPIFKISSIQIGPEERDDSLQVEIINADKIFDFSAFEKQKKRIC